MFLAPGEACFKDFFVNKKVSFLCPASLALFWHPVMVVQSLENLEILEKSGNKILVMENLEKLGNLTERAKNVIGNNAFKQFDSN